MIKTPKLETAAVVASEAAAAAVLPYWPVWAAAQFARRDEGNGKEILQFVHVFKTDHTIQIESTDGHRAFRYQLPTLDANGETLWQVPEKGLLLNAAALRKAVSKARLLTVDAELRCTFHGGNKTDLDELSSVTMGRLYSVSTVADCEWMADSFPMINGLWPDSFNNRPGKQFAFNARYLKEWFGVVEKLSTNGHSRVDCNSPTTPFVFTCDYEPRIGQHFETPRMELLLMPVQVRS